MLKIKLAKLIWLIHISNPINEQHFYDAVLLTLIHSFCINLCLHWTDWQKALLQQAAIPPAPYLHPELFFQSNGMPKMDAGKKYGESSSSSSPKMNGKYGMPNEKSSNSCTSNVYFITMANYLLLRLYWFSCFSVPQTPLLQVQHTS